MCPGHHLFKINAAWKGIASYFEIEVPSGRKAHWPVLLHSKYSTPNDVFTKKRGSKVGICSRDKKFEVEKRIKKF